MSKKERKELNKQAAELNEQELDNVSGGYLIKPTSNGDFIVSGVTKDGRDFLGSAENEEVAEALVKKYGLRSNAAIFDMTNGTSFNLLNRSQGNMLNMQRKQ